jgi:hypothetical protein
MNARDGPLARLAAGNQEEARLRNCLIGIGWP